MVEDPMKVEVRIQSHTPEKDDKKEETKDEDT